MTAQLEFAVKTVRSLSPNDKLELLQFLTRDLQETYSLAQVNAAFWIPRSIEAMQPNVPAISHLDSLALDFWPADETADDVNTFIAAQRQADRVHIA